MKRTYLFIITIAFYFSCNAQTEQAPQNQSDLFTQSDAEKILGERTHLSSSSSSSDNNSSTYQCSYTSDSPDAKTGKTGNIYVMIEDYSEIEPAKKTYSGIMESNKKNGITELNDLGDEAYFHTDKENFYFILVRKGKKMLRMKVNKITSVTSLEEFNNIATKITSLM